MFLSRFKSLNNSIENIEFEFINAFNNLINDYKPNIAFLTGNGQLNGSEILSIKYGLNKDDFKKKQKN